MTQPAKAISDHAPASLKLAEHQPANVEKQLLLLAQKGDRGAFGQLVRRVQDRLYNAVSRMASNPADAQDITQEAFTKALEHISDFRGDSGAYTWLFRIAMNVAINRSRSMKVRKATSLDHQPTDQMSTLRERLAGHSAEPVQVASDRERGQLVMRALADLDPQDRAILVMRDIDQMDYSEIASVIDVPMGTLKSKLFRARQALRQRFEQLEGK
jgi:RNA polymerase sigma-70 factor, ECF subfamily